MLKILLLFALLIAGIVLGPMIAGHQGYVLIQTDNYNIETSVTGLVIILILAMVVLFAIEWLLRRIFRTGAHTRGWFVGRKRRRARKQTEQALLKLAEGDYQQVEKLMAKNADHAEQPVVNYLLAAEAAQQRGDEARANQHLERATELAGDDLIPVEITRVRLQLARNENHAARHGIDKLLEITPRHPEVLRLAEQAYTRTGAWQSLLDIIPSMAKANVGDEEHRAALEQLEKVLRQQIKAVGDRPLLWSTLGQSLMRHGEWQEASIAFRAALKQRPDAFDYAWLADALDRLHQPEEAAAMRRDGLLLTLQNNPQP